MKIKKHFWDLCASHIIPNHPGKCRRLHGHNWQISLEVEGRIDPEKGMVADFHELKALMQPLYDRLDHQHLNYYMNLPTAENLAIYLAHEISPKAALLGLVLTQVSVCETGSTEAIWDGDSSVFLPLREARGWEPPVNSIPVFPTEHAMLRYAIRTKEALERHYKTMTEIGASLAAFERYQAGLDEKSARRLQQMLEKVAEEERYGLRTMQDQPPESDS